MKMSIEELDGKALDWATAKAADCKLTSLRSQFLLKRSYWQPRHNWSQTGPLISRFGISLSYFSEGHWVADVCEEKTCHHGPTPQIAACRAIVAAVFGESIEVPDEIVEVAA